MLRTWAVWDRDRRVAIGLAIWFTIIVVPIFVIMGLFCDSLSCRSACSSQQVGSRSYTPSSHSVTNPQLPNCFPISDRPIDSVAWILLVIFETGELSVRRRYEVAEKGLGILIPMIIKAIRKCKLLRSARIFRH